MDDELDDGPAPPPAGPPAWMATMADMMSLLLTFFVLLLSFANTDVVKFRMMLGSVQDAFGVQTLHPGDIEARATTPVELSHRESTPYVDELERPTRPRYDSERAAMDRAMLERIEKAISELGLGRLVEVESTSRGVVVRVKGQLLFDSGSAELRAESLFFLDEIAGLAQQFPYHVSIEGHTDDLPIATKSMPTNWHLSAFRAISALEYLSKARGVSRERLSAVGFADTRPLVPNDSAAHRATNRRVEFVYRHAAPTPREDDIL